MVQIDRNYRKNILKICTLLKEAWCSCIKAVFHYVVNKCIVFKNQIIHLFLLIKSFSDCRNYKDDIEFYTRQKDILDKKANCLENLKKIIAKKTESIELLHNFNNFVYIKDEKALETFDNSWSSSRYSKDCMEAGNRFCDDDETTLQDEENIKNRQKWAKHVKPFEEMMEKVIRISESRWELETQVLLGKEIYDEKTWDKINENLEVERNAAQDYYNNNLWQEFAAFDLWPSTASTDYKIFKQEKEFQKALIVLLDLELKNFNHVLDGRKSSLNFTGRSVRLNADADIALWIQYPKHLCNELIQAKLKEVQKETVIAKTRINEIKNKAKLKFKEDLL